MNYKGTAREVAETSGRLWRFADYEFDELARELRVKGKAVELESKPLDILLQLLLHAGEVVTKEELLESVWPDVMVVDGSLATAVSKLRKAMGDEDHPVIVTVPRVGYRLGVPVYCKTVAAAAGPELGFKAGDVVPGREQWRLSSPHGRLGIQRSLAGRESQDSRTTSIQVRGRRCALKRPEARDHHFPFPAGIPGRPAGVCPHPGVEFRNPSFFSRKRVCRAEPGGVGRHRREASPKFPTIPACSCWLMLPRRLPPRMTLACSTKT